MIKIKILDLETTYRHCFRQFRNNFDVEDKKRSAVIKKFEDDELLDEDYCHTLAKHADSFP